MRRRTASTVGQGKRNGIGSGIAPADLRALYHRRRRASALEGPAVSHVGGCREVGSLVYVARGNGENGIGIGLAIAMNAAPTTSGIIHFKAVGAGVVDLKCGSGICYGVALGSCHSRKKKTRRSGTDFNHSRGVGRGIAAKVYSLCLD